MDPARFQIITPSTHGDYRQIMAPLAEACWPEFMLHDPVADKHWNDLFERFSDTQFGILDTSSNLAAAMGNSVPLNWGDDLNNLPESGWDWAFEQAVSDDERGILPNTLCALQIAIHPQYRGQGLSLQMLQTMRDIGESKSFNQLIAPVRPNQKSQYPLIEMDRYIGWTTKEGHPFDAWLRVHTRIGGRIIKVCHQSMIIRGNLTEWESWTGLRFLKTGQYIVPGALNPIEMNLEKDEGCYYEPNIWIAHNLPLLMLNKSY